MMPHQILIGESASGLLQSVIRDRKVFYLVDSKVYQHVSSDLDLDNSDAMILVAGEDTKSLTQCEMVWEFLLQKKADKSCVLVNIGGGMLCDLGGFCASVYKRGIDFINVPTTLLAMVDASVGGKTAVNFLNRKNMLGTVAQPKHIVVCANLLQTLPSEEWLAGYAEIIKHAVIANNVFFEELERGFPANNEVEKWNKLISRNIELKSKITKEDPLDKTIRQTLNLGHTTAHALEAFGFQNNIQISHGQAVAAGLIIEANLALISGFLNEDDNTRIVKLVDLHFKRLSYQIKDIASIVDFAFDDKKNTGGKLIFSLPFAIGDVRFGIQSSSELFSAALKNYIK